MKNSIRIDRLVESCGTIQINNPQMNRFVDSVYDDINNEVYLLNELNLKNDRIHKSIINEYIDDYKIYKLSYFNPIDWIETFDFIIMIPRDPNDTKTIEEVSSFDRLLASRDKMSSGFLGAALFRNQMSVVYTKNTLKRGTIIIVNPDYDEDLKGTIYHELNHYVYDFNIFKHLSDSDNEFTLKDYQDYICRDNDYFDRLVNKSIANKNLYNLKLHSYTDDSIKELMNKFTDYQNVSDLNALYVNCCYYLNTYEINAYKEQIFRAFVRYVKKYGHSPKDIYDIDMMEISIHYRVFMNIRKLLMFIKDNIDNYPLVIKRFNIRYGGEYANIFKNNDLIDDGSYMTIQRLNSHFLYMMNKLTKHFNKMCEYALVVEL